VDPNTRVITVAGEGTASAVNDRCELSVAIRVTREHAADAMSEVAALAAKVVGVLEKAGVDPSHITTQNVTVQDGYDPQGQRVVGQQASYSLAIGVPALDQAGPVLQQLSAAARDALLIQGVTVSPSDLDTPRRAARARAVEDAQRRAAQLAEAAGASLGPLLAIEEGLAPAARPLPAGGPRLLAASAPMPIEGGTQHVTVRVVLTYELT
jgi:uncharacterized protein YggE